MSDLVLTEQLLDHDGDTVAVDTTTRFYRNGDILELQVYESGAWQTIQTWGE